MEAMGKPHDNNELEQMIHSENPDVFNQEVSNAQERREEKCIANHLINNNKKEQI